MSKKHIMNAGICCICTAVIFGLHFFVYGRMLQENPVVERIRFREQYVRNGAEDTAEYQLTKPCNDMIRRKPWFSFLACTPCG